jgi:hypothetical protein
MEVRCLQVRASAEKAGREQREGVVAKTYNSEDVAANENLTPSTPC